MIGEDCKKLELNIDKFLVVFIQSDKREEYASGSFLQMRQISVLYNKFKDIAR